MFRDPRSSVYEVAMQRSRPFNSLLIAGLLMLLQSQTIRSEELTQAPGAAVAKAWSTLKDGVADKDDRKRKNAIAAAGSIGADPQAVKMVAQALQDKDQEVRQAAAATLGQMKSPDAIPYLKAALDDTPQVSFTAAKSLSELGDMTGRGIFQEVIEGERTDAPGKLRGAIDDQKKKLGHGQFALVAAKDAAGTVFGPAGAGISAVQDTVKMAKGDPAAGGRSIAAEVLAKDSDPYALTLLEWALGDDNWSVRVAVAKALGERGNQASIAKLEPLLQDDHYEVRYMAAASIAKLASKKLASTAD